MTGGLAITVSTSVTALVELDVTDVAPAAQTVTMTGSGLLVNMVGMFYIIVNSFNWRGKKDTLRMKCQ